MKMKLSDVTGMNIDVHHIINLLKLFREVECYEAAKHNSKVNFMNMAKFYSSIKR